ncbi:RNA polymerase sigma factor SigJ [Frateuria terrea]|uniref:RNA polymerase sigma-70 factor, ECF subfamily n=1 Tax=Frateuria terrea TaxID=529704 RepID=A0A1H6QNU4_9GAMM|nr:RNA polymerase sigma factor SigJ [Frateuria terrea]SEI40945.1 RNA polymerase sigma-70 factor, ECF subfamily [Frateuria terrea]SFP06286.1 RNA polymerase sigma-70 factor, ECF subfamily [Frateuria terrea]
MDSQTALFQQHRPRLFGLAYRMLGSPADAEDVLHDAWLRWHAQDTAVLDDPEAWLVTVTTRLALDRLRRAKAEREHYTGPWLPEPLVPEADRPEAELERGETITLSFLLLLERLSPDERAAFLLNEVFDYSHAEAAAILGIGEDACRQRVHRARTRLRDGRPRFSVDVQARQRMIQRFIAAIKKPDLESLRALFAEDAIAISDGGGVVRAVLRPLQGADRLARLYTQVATRFYARPDVRFTTTILNGEPVLLAWFDDTLVSAIWIECEDDHITATLALRHPGKLARLAAVTKGGVAASLQ